MSLSRASDGLCRSHRDREPSPSRPKKYANRPCLDVLFIYRDAARLIGPSNYCGKSATAAGHGHSHRSKKHFFWHAPFSCRQPWCDSDLIALVAWCIPHLVGSGLHQEVSQRQKYVDNLIISCERETSAIDSSYLCKHRLIRDVFMSVRWNFCGDTNFCSRRADTLIREKPSPGESYDPPARRSALG